MNNENLFTVKEMAERFKVPVSTVYSWINRNKLSSKKINGKLLILPDEQYSTIVSEIIHREVFGAPDEPYFPDELIGYSDWHQSLDYLSWLFKVSYTNPNEIKKRRFNLREIFENYLDVNKIDLKYLKRSFLNKNANIKLIVNDLKRGWYNELAFIYPLKNATLGLSFREVSQNIIISNTRFLFPSWKITECYYSSYFYLRSITQFKNPYFRIQKHKATLNAFKNNTLDSLKKTIWKFPLDIEYKPNSRYYISKAYVSNLDYINFNYSKHPRSPYLSPIAITKELQSKFRKRGKSFSKPSHYTVFDFMLEFRIWANYLDIDNLLSLYGEGYKAYLDQNLSLLIFFIGGLSELIFISVYGEGKYLNELQNLYDLFAKNNNDIKDNFIYSSVYQRMRIYRLRGLISREINIESAINENEIN